MKKASAVKDGPAKDVDAYLASVPEPARTTLTKLRAKIKAAATKATESIGYQMPVYKHDGPLVAFAAWKDHCSLYGMGTSVTDAFKNELKGYETSKGTIRFPSDKPMPAALVKKIVKLRLAENAEVVKQRAAKAAAKKAQRRA